MDKQNTKQASRLLSGLPTNYINDILEDRINLICLDFGHGETTAAKMEAYTDGSSRKLRVMPLNTNAGENQICKRPTYIYVYKDANDVEIGIDSKSRAISGAGGDFYCYFKCMPSRAENYLTAAKSTINGERITHAQAMQWYVQKYLDLIFTPEAIKQGQCHLDPQKRTVLVIGRPSGSKWEKEEDEYRNILSNVRINGEPPLATIIVSESFAALAQSVNDSEDIGFDFEDTVVCVDMGSSTADITCMNKGEIAYEYGISLGAHLIECNLLDCAIDHINKNNDTHFSIEHIEDGYTLTLADFREYKENFFGDATKQPMPNLKMQLFLSDETEDFGGRIRLSTELMDKVCKDTPISFKDKNAPDGVREARSWYHACRDFFQKACQDIYKLVDDGKIPPVKIVILTGGASRMDFVSELADEVFGQAREKGVHNDKSFLLYHSKEPSYTVSKGLAWISYNAAKTEKILMNVKNKLEDIIEDNCYVGICDSISEIITPVLYDLVNKEIGLWSKRTHNESINGFLTHYVEPQCTTMIAQSEIQTRILEAIITWFNNGGVDKSGILKALSKEFSSMFGVDLSDIDAIKLPDDMANELASSVGKLSLQINSSRPVECGLSWLGFGFWINLNRSDYPSDTRARFSQRWTEREVGIKNEIIPLISKQILEQTDLFTRICEYMKDTISDTIDKSINNISMYCFKVSN